MLLLDYNPEVYYVNSSSDLNSLIYEQQYDTHNSLNYFTSTNYYDYMEDDLFISECSESSFITNQLDNSGLQSHINSNMNSISLPKNNYNNMTSYESSDDEVQLTQNNPFQFQSYSISKEYPTSFQDETVRSHNYSSIPFKSKDTSVVNLSRKQSNDKVTIRVVSGDHSTEAKHKKEACGSMFDKRA